MKKDLKQLKIFLKKETIVKLNYIIGGTGDVKKPGPPPPPPDSTATTGHGGRTTIPTNNC